MQRILVPLFMLIWWNKLNYSKDGMMVRDQVIYVKSLTTAIIDSPGRGRSTTKFLFKVGRHYYG